NGVRVAVDQPWKKNHALCVYDKGLLSFGWIMVRTDIGDHSILDPDGLLLDKLSCENIEDGAIGNHRIRSDVTQGHLAEVFSLFHILHGRFHNKDEDPCQSFDTAA